MTQEMRRDSRQVNKEVAFRQCAAALKRRPQLLVEVGQRYFLPLDLQRAFLGQVLELTEDAFQVCLRSAVWRDARPGAVRRRGKNLRFDRLGRRLVLAQPQKHRGAQMTVVGAL